MNVRRDRGVKPPVPSATMTSTNRLSRKCITMTTSSTTPARKWRRPPRGGITFAPYKYDPGPLTFTQGLECFYCGGQVTYAKATFDHIIPRSRVNPACLDLADAPDNLVVACSPCNMSKGTRTFDEWFTVILERMKPGQRSHKNWERESDIICRGESIAAMIAFRHLEHIDPNYEGPKVTQAFLDPIGDEE